MSTPQTPGHKFINFEKYGNDGLAHQQDEFHRLRSKRDHWLHSGARGLIVPRLPSGQLGPSWSIDKDEATGRIRINPGARPGPYNLSQYPSVEAGLSCAAIGPAGDYFEHIEDFRLLAIPYLLQLTDDGVWRTLVVRRVRTHREVGYLSVTMGSATVTGVGTEFTRLRAFTDDGLRGAKLRIPPSSEVANTLGRGGSTLGNEGTYEVDSVASDTSLTLRTPIPQTEAGLVYTVEGDFIGTAPTAPAGDVRLYDRAEFQLVARTIVPAASDFAVADIKYDSTANPKIQIVDRRPTNLYRQMPQGASGVPWLEAVSTNSFSTVSNTANGNCTIPFNPAGPIDAAARISPSFGTNIENLDLCPMQNGWMAIVQATDEVRVRWYNFNNAGIIGDFNWNDPGGAVTKVDVSGLVDFITVIQVPQPDKGGAAAAATHVVLYVKSQIVYKRTTADNGATWSGETIVWNPTVIDPLDAIEDIQAIVLQCGRILLVGVYYDDSAALRTIRFVYSDNLGGAWQVNSHNGTTWAQAASGKSSMGPSIFQDDFGRIHTAWIEQPPVPGDLWFVNYERSTSQYTLARAGGGATPASARNTTKYSNEGSQSNVTTALWADPGGTANVIVDEYVAAGVARKLIAYVFGDATDLDGMTQTVTCLDARILLYLDDDGLQAAGPIHACPRIEQAGLLFLAFVIPESGATAAWWVPLHAAYTPGQLGIWTTL